MATSHIITAIIGAGVLGLPYALSWVGWVAGCLLLMVFYIISVASGLMLTDVYEVDGKKHPTYRAAVLGIMGEPIRTQPQTGVWGWHMSGTVVWASWKQIQVVELNTSTRGVGSGAFLMCMRCAGCF